MNFFNVLTLLFCAGAMVYILGTACEEPEDIQRGDVLMFLWCALKMVEIIFKC